MIEITLGLLMVVFGIFGAMLSIILFIVINKIWNKKRKKLLKQIERE